jgi:peptidoglycan/LPS O-acetylase OafA/YrhL
MLACRRFQAVLSASTFFFVISGYLITRKISADLLAGSFSFRQFYLARLRRLYPALLATVAVTLLIGALLFSPPHLAKLAASAVASLLTFSNIYFWNEVGYWDIEVGLKPLLHIWSLSVEEQFYFVLPLILWGASRLRSPRVAIVAVVAVSGIASLCTATDFPRSAVFYWMPLRAFEFAIGASIIWFEMIPMPRFVREIDAVVGIGAIGYAVFFFNEKTAFPYAGALYPCIGTALLIYAGGSPVTANLWNNRLMIAIGRISYSLYLVHWPVVIFYSYWRISPLALGERIGLLAASLATLSRNATQRFFGRRAPRHAVSPLWLARHGIATVGPGAIPLRRLIQRRSLESPILAKMGPDSAQAVKILYCLGIATPFISRLPSPRH